MTVGSPMGWYQRHLLPRIIHLACGSKPVGRQREKVVPRARGRVLEVGLGSGLNLPFYDARRVSRLWGLEPSPELRVMAARQAAAAPFTVELLESPVEETPLADGSVDTVVVTYTLCSLADPVGALRLMARVLAPGGELLFCEHGAAPDPGVRRWQDRVNPLWRRLGGGCNLNREIPALIAAGGFRLLDLETAYLPGWRPASFNYRGAAAPA